MKIDDIIICKKEMSSHNALFIPNNKYKITQIRNNDKLYYITDDNNELYFVDNHHSPFYIFDYFYTLDEIRLIKLNSL